MRLPSYWKGLVVTRGSTRHTPFGGVRAGVGVQTGGTYWGQVVLRVVLLMLLQLVVLHGLGLLV